jgi:hypothetical protein
LAFASRYDALELNLALSNLRDCGRWNLVFVTLMSNPRNYDARAVRPGFEGGTFSVRKCIAILSSDE